MTPYTVGQPAPEREPREPWWVAPVCFGIVGAFWCAVGLTWFAEQLA